MKNLIIFYQVVGDRVEILRVVNGYRDLKGMVLRN